MRFFREESGQALVLVALSLTALMGAMALAVDAGFARFRQRQLQAAADSAAIAAGLELGNCNYTVCANMEAAAEQALIENNITTANIAPTVNSSQSSCAVPASSPGLALTINVAPCVLGASDPNNGNTHMAEVVLTEPQRTFFGAILGVRSLSLVARAEAGDSLISGGGGGNCLWAGSILFNSSDGNFNLTDCGIYDNGGLTTNSGDSVTASDFLYYGTWSPNDCGSSCTWNIGGTNTGSPTKTTTQQNDPLAGLQPPTQPTTQDANNCSISNMDCSGNAVTASKPVSVPPGYYGGGININSNVTVNLSPGLYYFNGSLAVDSGATLECTTCSEGGAGVTLYFTNGSFQPNSSATVMLNAPAAGATSNGNVANMLVWQSSTNSSGMDLDASTSVTLNGVIYLPDATLTLNSGSGTTINSGATATAVDVQGLIVDSNVTFDLKGSQPLLGGGGPTLGAFALSE